MINVKELESGDIVQYQKGLSVIFIGVIDDKVILHDDVIGEIKILKNIFESNYSYL
jgi:hypothetical protein